MLPVDGGRVRGRGRIVPKISGYLNQTGQQQCTILQNSSHLHTAKSVILSNVAVMCCHQPTNQPPIQPTSQSLSHQSDAVHTRSSVWGVYRRRSWLRTGVAMSDMRSDIREVARDDRRLSAPSDAAVQTTTTPGAVHASSNRYSHVTQRYTDYATARKGKGTHEA